MIIAQAPGIVAYSASGNANATTVSGLLTTAKIFPAMASGAASGSACILTLPGSSRLEGKVFYVSASGLLTTGASTITVQPQFFGVVALPTVANQLTPGSYTQVAAPTGVSIASASTVPWFLEAELIGDSISGILHGNMRTVINNTLTGPVALTSTLTSVSFKNDPVAYVAVGVSFSVSNAANADQLDAFYCSAD